MGFGGPVAIRLDGIEAAIRRVRPEDPDATYDKLLALGRSVIADIADDAKAKSTSKK